MNQWAAAEIAQPEHRLFSRPTIACKLPHGWQLAVIRGS
jgi:hypothetical protein